ncbi:hypothetical protein KGM_212073B, partial [Danaus plexippus plexippus]
FSSYRGPKFTSLKNHPHKNFFTSQLFARKSQNDDRCVGRLGTEPPIERH